jgi:hypothetical protein
MGRPGNNPRKRPQNEVLEQRLGLAEKRRARGRHPLVVVRLGTLRDELLDTIHRMLEAGELRHAPPDYWEERARLERRRRDARRRRRQKRQAS